MSVKDWLGRWFGFEHELAALQSEKQQIQEVLSQSIDAVITINHDNNVVFFNAAAEKMWGYSQDEVLGRNVKMLVPEAIRSNHDELVNANRRSGVNKIVGKSREIEVFRRDGSKFWGSLSLSKVQIDGAMYYTAFLRDVTEQKEASEFISQTLEQAIDGVVTIDQNNIVRLFNSAAEKIWGYSREEVIGKNVKMLVPEDIRSNHDNLVNANRQTGIDKIVGTSREIEVPTKDGNTLWCSLSLSKVKMDKEIHYTAFVKDVSQARRQRQFTQQTMEQAIDAVVAIDNKNIVTVFNKAAEELWGYERNEVLGQNVKMLVPMDLQANHDHFVDSNRTTGVDKIVGKSREVPVYRKNGEKRWGNLALSKINMDGEYHYTAFVRDVTEEVKRRTEFQTLSLVANETDNSVIITNADCEIEYVNPGFTKLTGYELKDAQGKKPGDLLQGPDTDPETKRRIREKLDAHEAFYDEILNYDRDGSTYWISLAINPVFGDDGNVSKFISIQANITDTKLQSLEYNYKLEAISRANAEAEFALDGTLQQANLLFLEILEQSSVKDKKITLSSLIDRKYFDDVWSKISTGEFSGGEFKVLVGGKAKWISGSFNPIFDGSGKVAKFVFYGIDVSQRKAGIEAISSGLQSLAKGDITQTIDGCYDEELDKICDAFNLSATKLNELLSSIKSVAEIVANGSREIANGNADLHQRVESQASSLEQTASTMEELTASASNNAAHAAQVDNQAQAAGKSAKQGHEVVTKAVASMDDITIASKKMADIITVIDEIAFQTNLLALNAAVEAARAGEQGRGFAVVAGEVRNLAQRSSSAAKEIGDLIKDTVNKVNEGTALVNQSGQVLESIAEKVTSVTAMIAEISSASVSQQEGITEANSAVASMDGMTQQNAALVEEANAASQEMLSSSESMLRDLSIFTIRQS